MKGSGAGGGGGNTGIGGIDAGKHMTLNLNFSGTEEQNSSIRLSSQILEFLNA